jgi:hypothetical protein
MKFDGPFGLAREIPEVFHGTDGDFRIHRGADGAGCAARRGDSELGIAEVQVAPLESHDVDFRVDVRTFVGGGDPGAVGLADLGVDAFRIRRCRGECL